MQLSASVQPRTNPPKFGTTGSFRSFFDFDRIPFFEPRQLSLLTAEGDAKDDLNLPSGTDDLDKLSQQVKDMFAEGKGIRIVTMTAIGQEQLCGVSEDK